MIISFAGHSGISVDDKLKIVLKEQICAAIENEDFTTFYLGGYGEFDGLCAVVCAELKKNHDNIETVYVSPYLHEHSKIKDIQSSGLYDSLLYPPIENTPLRFAIVKRNEWMIENSDLVITYVNKSFGGAYKSLQVAKRKHKRIINIYDIINQDL